MRKTERTGFVQPEEETANGSLESYFLKLIQGLF